MSKSLYEMIKYYDDLANQQLTLSIMYGTGEFNEPKYYAKFEEYKKISEDLQRELILKAAQKILDMKEEIQLMGGEK